MSLNRGSLPSSSINVDPLQGVSSMGLIGLHSSISCQWRSTLARLATATLLFASFMVSPHFAKVCAEVNDRLNCSKGIPLYIILILDLCMPMTMTWVVLAYVYVHI